MEEAGFGFMFAPNHHAATRFVIPVRRELAVRTIFNFLGPLTNPAGATRQLVGVSAPAMLDRMAGALARLGAERALVVSCEDGLDEVSTSAPTRVVEVAEGEGPALRRRPGGVRPGARSTPAPCPAARPRSERETIRRDLRRRGRAGARHRAAQRRGGDLRRRPGRHRWPRASRPPREAVDSGAAARRRSSASSRRTRELAGVNVLERDRGQSTREEVERRRREVPLADARARASSAAGEDRPFSEALVRPGISLIAEYKRRSPSAGAIREGADVGEIVCAYERGGAAALSVLTEGRTSAARSTTCARPRGSAQLPVLRKDFIVDPYQVVEAAVAGADAILLIVAALEQRDLAALYASARDLDLDVLVEVHDEGELEAALELDAEVIGINNRDLERPHRRPRPHLRAALRRARGQDRGLRVGLPHPRRARRPRADRRRRRARRRVADARRRGRGRRARARGPTHADDSMPPGF